MQAHYGDCGEPRTGRTEVWGLGSRNKQVLSSPIYVPGPFVAKRGVGCWFQEKGAFAFIIRSAQSLPGARRALHEVLVRPEWGQLSSRGGRNLGTFRPHARGGREVWQVEQDRDAEARRDDRAPVIRRRGPAPPDVTPTWSAGSTLRLPRSRRTHTERLAVHRGPGRHEAGFMVPFPGRPGEGVLSQPWAGPTSLTPRHIAKSVRDVTSRRPAPATVTETLAGRGSVAPGKTLGPGSQPRQLPLHNPHITAGDWSRPGLGNCTQQTSVPPKRPTP